MKGCEAQKFLLIVIMVGDAGGTFIIFFCDAAHDEMQQALVPDIIIFFPTFSQLFRLSTFPFFIIQNKTRVLNTFLVEIYLDFYV